MKYIVRSDTSITPTLVENNRTESVLQNIHLILSTPKGSVPMYRDFGIDTDFLDRPLPAIQTQLAARVKDSITTFEKRATIESISFDYDKKNPEKIIIVVEVDVEDE